jgi:CRP-like cAMP-binding protein
MVYLARNQWPPYVRCCTDNSFGARTIMPMNGERCANQLLASLRRKVRAPLLAAAETVELAYGDVIWEPSQSIRHVYFPNTGFISQLFPVDARKNLELAMIGNEGMLGIPLVLGVNATMMQAMVQGSGTALRIDAAAFRRELEQLPELRLRLHRYIYVTMIQLSLTTTCNSFHSLEARLARWLLMTHDRAQLGGFQLTHTFLAQMLGVRRAGVTNAAGQLQIRKLIRYGRGNISVLNRAGLEKVSCGCYRSGVSAYERVLGRGGR